LDQRDFFRDPLSREELQELASIVTMDELFSWRSPSAKQYRDKKADLSESELIDLMMEEPRLIRRPIAIRMDDTSRHVLGGKKADLESIALD
jgi:arsenate reductase-like glutaredoxin family protein